MVYAEVDMSNQINNSWNKNTVLAITQANLKCSIMIEVNNKIQIKKFCEENFDFKHNGEKRAKRRKKLYINRVVSLTHAYLLYRIIIANKDVLTDVKVCGDTMPKYLHNHYQSILQNTNTKHLVNHVKIKYGIKKKNNSAQKYAKSVASGKVQPMFKINVRDTEQIISLIKKFIPKN